MISIDQLIAFNTVVRIGSLSGAEEELGIKVSAISTRLSSLEKNLNTVLMKRSKAGIELTSQGRLLFEFIKDFIPKLESIEEVINSNSDNIKGPLKVTTWHGIGSFLLPEYVIKFRKKYPDVLINILGDNRERDFADYNSDALIFPHYKEREDLIQLKIFSIQLDLYASKDYIAKYGAPKSLGDLVNHRLIGTTTFPEGAYLKTDWHLFQGTERMENFIKPFLVINSTAGVYNYCINGEGIGAFPYYYLDESSKDKLVKLFPEFQPPVLDFYYIYEKSMQDIPRIKAFGEFLLDAIPKLKEFK